MNLAQRLLAAKNPLVRDLATSILDYESGLDGEFACCHSSQQIADGECTTNPNDIEALQILEKLVSL